MKNIELLRPLLLQDLLCTEITTDNCDFKKWVSSGKYLVRNISTNMTVDIEVNNEHAFHHMIAFDSCRMAAAAFETMLNIQASETLPKSIGWISIKTYYAAFFSAHSIMRCFGYVCSQLERGHANQLNEFGSIVGLSNTIKPEAGFFSGSYSPHNRILTIKKMKNTHEDTWSTLLDCLNKVSQDVLTIAGLSSRKQTLSADINDLVVRLTDSGRLPKGNFLSQYRNAVNYRHEYDSWHPYGKQSIKSEKIISLLGNWKSENYDYPPVWKGATDSYNFFICCRDVLNLNYLLINLIIKSSGKVNFYKRWPGKLLNISSAA